jgi:hypothetical protein
MGDKSAFNLGYNNSNDASYRTLLNVSKPENVYQKTDASNHNQWVQNNGPFKVYMQNVLVPSITDWQTYGMNATVYSSDQSYWGFGDVPQPSGVFSRIRALLGVDTKCLVALWTTTSIGLFHQACTGQSIGQALLHTMNHNTTNQHLEKPQQQYDTEAWWNRTHFEIWGDPTISLYQVKPVNNLTLTNVSGNPVLQWTPSSDSAVLGYHIYESNTELGVFQRISTSPITITNFTIPNYNPSHWYMVKAIKVVESGCGKLLQSSIGKSIQADVNLTSAEFQTTKSWMVYPNPVKDQLQIRSKSKLEKIRIYNNLNQLVLNIQPKTTDCLIDCSSWQSGLYFIEIIDELQKRDTIKIIKE